jgi:hypothetical protein
MSTDVSGVPPEELMTLVQRVFAQFRELQEQVERLGAAAGDRQRSRPVVTPPAEPPPPDSPTALTKTLESLASQAHASVRGVLQGGRGLRHYLSQIDKLSPDERRDIVDQAVTLLEGYYAHLQLKKAMYGFDPVQRLRLLRRRLGRYGSEIAFHNELTDIFTNLRDLHTNYLLPDYFARSAAFLPFRVKYCWENGERIYIVTQTMPGVTDPNFQPGVRITYWNAVLIDRAVEIAASYHAGSNPAARHARGVDGLTQRGLRMSAPPDDEWVIVGYVDLAGEQREFRAEWSVTAGPVGWRWSVGRAGQARAQQLGPEDQSSTRARSFRGGQLPSRRAARSTTTRSPNVPLADPSPRTSAATSP